MVGSSQKQTRHRLATGAHRVTCLQAGLQLHLVGCCSSTLLARCLAHPISSCLLVGLHQASRGSQQRFRKAWRCACLNSNNRLSSISASTRGSWPRSLSTKQTEPVQDCKV